MIIPKKKWLYIPIEAKSREYKAKLFLSILALKKGYNVMLGQQSFRIHVLITSLLPVGIYLDKSIWDVQTIKFKILKKRGHYICATDEEGLFYRNPESYLRRISLNSLKALDLFFAWGNEQANIISKKYPQIKNKIKVVGNPRIDILRREYINIYKKENDYIKKKYGKFILVNSNFPDVTTNTLKGKISEIEFLTNNVEEKEKEFWKNFFKYKSELFNLFLKAIKELAKSTSLRIVIRPHPAENPDLWIKEFKGFENVAIVYKYSANPWIIESEIVIHNGCTTGIEAFLMKKPVIAYRPIKSALYDQNLPNLVSKEINDEDELLNLVRLISENNDSLPIEYNKKLELLNDHIKFGEGLSSERILEFLELFDIKAKSFEISSFKKALIDIYVFLRKIICQNLRFYFRQNKKLKHKFPGITKKELKHDLDIVKDLINYKKKIDFLEIFPNQFIIFSDPIKN